MNKKLSIIGMLLILVFSAGAAIIPGTMDTTLNPGEEFNGAFTINNTHGTNLTNITFELNVFNGVIVEAFTPSLIEQLNNSEISDEITFKFTVPAGTEQNNYTGTYSYSADQLNSTQFESFNFTVNEVKDIAIDFNQANLNDLLPGESRNTTLVITNTGNVDLTNISISHDLTDFMDAGDNQIDINFSEENGFDLLVNSQAKEIIVTVTTHTNQYFYPEETNDYSGPITIASAEYTESFNLNVDLEMMAFKNIEITNLGDFEDLIPGEEFDIEIEFDYAKFDIDDIEVEMVISDFDAGDDLEMDSDEFNMDHKEDYELEFSLGVPLDVNDDRYGILLNINGDSDSDDELDEDFEYNVYYGRAIDVKKDENYDAGFNFVRLEPELPMCGGSFTLTAEVINTGEKRLNDMYIKLKINELDILEISEEFDLKITENNRDEKVEFFINLPTGMEAKEYDIEIIAYDEDNDIIGSEIVTFTPYGNCVQVEAEEEESSEEPSSADSPEGTLFMPTGWSVGNFLGNDTAKTSFWVIGDLALIVIITYFLFLFFKKRK